MYKLPSFFIVYHWFDDDALCSGTYVEPISDHMQILESGQRFGELLANTLFPRQLVPQPGGFRIKVGSSLSTVFNLTSTLALTSVSINGIETNRTDVRWREAMRVSSVSSCSLRPSRQSVNSLHRIECTRIISVLLRSTYHVRSCLLCLST